MTRDQSSLLLAYKGLSIPSGIAYQGSKWEYVYLFKNKQKNTPEMEKEKDEFKFETSLVYAVPTNTIFQLISSAVVFSPF